MRTIRDEDRRRDDDSDDHATFNLADGAVTVTTPRAMKVDLGGRLGERWIPHSQVHDDSEVYWEERGGLQGLPGKLVIKGWFARKEGLAEE